MNLILRPLRITTNAFIVFGVIFFLLGLLFILGPLSMVSPGEADYSWLIGLSLTVPISGIGLFFLIRAPLAKLLLTDSEAVLVNMFRTYRIPREKITGVVYRTDINGNLVPSIEWKDADRKKHVVKISFLAPARIGGLGQAKLNAMEDQVFDWADPKAAVKRKALREDS